MQALKVALAAVNPKVPKSRTAVRSPLSVGKPANDFRAGVSNPTNLTRNARASVIAKAALAGARMAPAGPTLHLQTVLWTRLEDGTELKPENLIYTLHHPEGFMYVLELLVSPDNTVFCVAAPLICLAETVVDTATVLHFPCQLGLCHVLW